MHRHRAGISESLEEFVKRYDNDLTSMKKNWEKTSEMIISNTEEAENLKT